MLLALETATDVCSVAFCDNDGDLFEKRIEKRGAHSEQLFLFIAELMEEHDFRITELSALLVSEGPGSYTGLRIGASAVKGLLFQTEVPLYGVNTLASFAVGSVDDASPAGTIHAIIDARRVHVYHQQFHVSGTALAAGSEVEVLPIDRFESMVASGDLITGTGLNRISEDIKAKTVTRGPGAITARSLVKLYRHGYEAFFHPASPPAFEPKYYTSNQVNGG
ncbi:tRNA threonylcarbamoyladenosine biosynthesis protein TsaB [Fodinibius roseus]|uniref:tRNA threonylcarbamoyladenosine biosynthesis protein TsaB n=1 Tax=Fodinibius roseus TaxID=1194090 RepID=A0A1M5GF87_9BACT|nr:tRNA (adenosine(37)-N6)-threonylcarbamoyltransferase complex dimerization subunit type 1 TsaB [Fodinibius roseus]SHG02450.1 tRNA threonylcarbamoyladenosine biosynthesis protein TsaB [Fodinibius roseus]